MIYIYAILSCIYSLFEGAQEAYYYHEVVKDGLKKPNIHWVFVIQRFIFLILLFKVTNAFIAGFYICTFSLIHDGAYCYTRNKLNKLIYPKRFFDESTTSTAILEFSFNERVILALYGILFIFLNINCH